MSNRTGEFVPQAEYRWMRAVADHQHRLYTAEAVENARLQKALADIITESNDVSSYTKADLADIARAALSGR